MQRHVPRTAVAPILAVASAVAGGVVLLLGVASLRPAAHPAFAATGGDGSGVSIDSGDALPGRDLYLSNCAACHGVYGQGMPRQGPSLKESALLGESDDETVLRFLIEGRSADDPDSLMRLPMPPRAGNLWLTDEQLRLITTYTRKLQDMPPSR